MNEKDDSIEVLGFGSELEISNNKKFYKFFKNSPIPENEILSNLGLYIKRQGITRILVMNELYKKIIDVNGIIIEFGVRWG